MKRSQQSKERRPLSAEAALTRLAALCAQGEQAEADLRGKLARWGVPPAQHDGIIAQLKQQGFISEERYARAFVHDRFTFNSWGRLKIMMGLRQKGVGPQAAARALEQINEQDYRATLRRLLASKWPAVRGREPRLARAALARFAASRGYEPNVFFPLIDQIAGDDEPETMD